MTNTTKSQVNPNFQKKSCFFSQAFFSKEKLLVVLVLFEFGISLKGVEIGEKNFKEEVLDSDKPVFVLFWASWCTASKRMEHTIKELKEEYESDGSTKIKIRTVNVDKNPGLRFQHDIRQVPTYVIFNGGKIVERRIAAQSKKQLRKMIENAIK